MRGQALRGLAVLFGLSAGAAQAQEAIFDVTLAGVPVAEMTVEGRTTDGRYAVAVMIRSNGLVGMIRHLRFESRSEGRIARDGDSFVPDRYTEQADTGRRQSQVEMVYAEGVPQTVVYSSPRPDGPDLVDPATQGGTLDPATALFAGLRDRPAGQGCKAGFAVFDGRRRSAYSLSGDGLTCTGEYRRIAGYTPEEMAERSSFPLQVVYAAEGDVMRVVEARVQTIYGKVRLKRR